MTRPTRGMRRRRRIIGLSLTIVVISALTYGYVQFGDQIKIDAISLFRPTESPAAMVAPTKRQANTQTPSLTDTPQPTPPITSSPTPYPINPGDWTVDEYYLDEYPDDKYYLLTEWQQEIIFNRLQEFFEARYRGDGIMQPEELKEYVIEDSNAWKQYMTSYEQNMINNEYSFLEYPLDSDRYDDWGISGKIEGISVNGEQGEVFIVTARFTIKEQTLYVLDANTHELLRQGDNYGPVVMVFGFMYFEDDWKTNYHYFDNLENTSSTQTTQSQN